MKVIVGLGNPGGKYERTRHNAGYIFADAIADYFGWDSYYDVDEWKRKSDKQYTSCRAMAGGEPKIIFCKPLVFMNTSGLALKEIVEDFDVKVESELVLAHDDLDIPLGKYKIQSGASPKEHKGVKHVEQMLGKKDFLRIRIGVDSREGERTMPGDEYVLQKFSKDENQVIDETIAACIKNFRSQLQL